MSTVIAPAAETPPVHRPSLAVRARRRLWGLRRRLVILAIVCAVMAAAAWFGLRAYAALTATHEAVIPTATVQLGDLSLAVTARGELRGGNPETLTAPLTGGADMHITTLLRTGAEVKNGDVAVQFDTTEQEYKLKEAESDLAEADQHILQAKAQRDAEQEEDRYALLKAQSDVKLAELDVRKNPLVPTITARQNTLALEAARDHLTQLQNNQASRNANNQAAIEMQEAGRGKAEYQAKTARQNIDAMTLRTNRAGYISVKQNSSGNFFYTGMVLPQYQVGDTVRPGMAVAEVPDLKNWEIGANIGELDRGHLAAGEKVAITIIAVPNQRFTGHVKELGSTSGPPWDRKFECSITLDNPSPELRPGMTANIVVTTDDLRHVLWLPAQALFGSDGRTFVYVRSGAVFSPKDVKLVRRNETRVVVAGLQAGQVVALADPVQAAVKKPATASPLQALPK